MSAVRSFRHRLRRRGLVGVRALLLALVLLISTIPAPAGTPLGAQPALANANVDLAVISGGDDPDPAAPGVEVTYIFFVQHEGPSNNAASVTVTVDAFANLGSPTATFTGPGGSGTCTPAGGGLLSCAVGSLGRGQSARIEAKATVSGPAGSVAVMAARASSSTTSDPSPGNDSVQQTTTINAPFADVGVGAIGDTPDPAQVGQTVTYRFFVANRGVSESDTTTTVVLDPEFSSAAGSWTLTGGATGTCTGAGNTLTCSLGLLADGIGSQIVVTGVVSSYPSDGNVSVTASVQGSLPDPDPTNNSASLTTTVDIPTTADLTILKTDTPDPVAPGGRLTYQIAYSNAGPSTASAAVVTDNLPSGVTFVSASTGCTHAAGVVTCQVGTLQPGDSGNLTIEVDVSAAARGTLTNTAEISSPVVDPTPGNNSSTAVTTIDAPEADLGITKQGPTSAAPGEQITFTLDYQNAGPDAAGAVVVEDFLASTTFEFVSATSDRGSCSYINAIRRVLCSVGDLASGDSGQVTVTVRVPLSATPGSTITNQGGIVSNQPGGAPDDPNPADNQDSWPVTVSDPQADLTIIKTASADTVDPGDQLVYTLEYFNTGPSTAQQVVIADLLPAGVVFVSATDNGGASCSASTGGVTCTRATLAPGGAGSVTIVVNVAPTATGTLTNLASITSSTADPDPTDNSDTTTTRVTASADLSILKGDSPDPVVAGEQITFTLGYQNDGPTLAAGVTITDTLPGVVSYVSATSDRGSCTESGGTVTCDLGVLAPGASGSVQIVAAVPASASDGSQISNTASIAGTTADPNPANNSSTATTTVSSEYDLSVTKVGSVDPVGTGESLTYTIDYANAGPSVAAGVTVTDTLPAGVTFASATSDDGSCVESAAGVVTCTLGDLAPAATGQIEIVVDVDAGTPPGTLTNSAVIAAATGTDTDPGNDTATEDTTVIVRGSADVSVTKSDTPDPVTAGTGIAYTIDYANAGPADATNVTVFDILPAGVTFVGAPAVCAQDTANPQVVACDLGTVAAGDSGSIDILAQVDASTPAGTVTNQVTIAAAELDPVPGNNSDSEDTTVVTSADMSITKSGRDTVAPTKQITYTIGYANAGPSDALDVVVVDPLPAGVTFVSATPDQGTCNEAGGTFSCDLGTVPAGASGVITVIVTVDATTPAGDLVNTVRLSRGGTPDPNPDNDTASHTTTVVIGEADLGVAKSGPATVVAGEVVTYTLDYTNAGTSDALDVTVFDTLPPGTSFDAAGSSPGCVSTGAGTVACSVGTVVETGSGSVTIALRVAPDVPAGTVLTNTAVIAGTLIDPNPDNDSDTVDTTVEARADLSITKADDVDPVDPGDPLTYEVVVSNAGPSDAADVEVVDTLPVGVAFVSATGSCAESAGTVTCDLGTLPAGDSATVAIVVTVADDLGPTTLVNAAEVTSTTADPDPSNNRVEETTAVRAVADLAVVKVDVPDPVQAGEALLYTIAYGNFGPADVTDAVIVDSLPPGVMFVTATAPCLHLAGTVTCDIGSVPAGGIGFLTILTQVLPDTPSGTITNTVRISSSTPDPNPANDTGSADTTVEGTAPPAAADLAVTKSAPATVLAGAQLTYTVGYRNLGPAQGAAAAVVDLLPAGTSFVSASDSGGGACTESAGTVTCDVGDLDPGDAGTITVVVGVAPDAVDGSTLTNGVSISSSTSDPVPGNNTATASTTVGVEADVAVTKTADVTTVAPGQPVTYTITVSNAGPSAAPDVVVTDILPVSLTLTSVTASGASCSGTTTVICSIASLAPGASETIVIATVVASSASGTVTNSVSAVAGIGDPVTDNNLAVAGVTIRSGDLPFTGFDLRLLIAAIGMICLGLMTLAMSRRTAAHLH